MNLSRKPKFNIIALIIIALVLVLAGTYIVFKSHAATNNADFNNSGKVDITDISILAAHFGTASGATHAQGDANGDGAVNVTDLSILASQWNTTIGGGVPAQCATGGSFLWNNLEICGWAGPGNTGPNLAQCPGGVLTTNSGATTRTITISTPNTVISCQNITGGLIIAATNVTIKNSKIAWDGGGNGGHGVITINDGASATVDHVDANGLNRTHACIFNSGLKGSSLAYSLVAKNVNCHNTDDGIFSWWWPSNVNAGAGSDFMIQDSYLHDFTQGAANGHMDGFQTEGAQNGTITHNTFKMNEVPGDVQVSGGGINSAISMWDDYNTTSPLGKLTTNFTIINNLIAGGGFSFYAEDRSPGDGSPGNASPVGGNEETQIHYVNNKLSTFVEGGCVGSFGVWFYRGPGESASLIWPPYYGGPTDGWNKGGSSRIGNVILETGENVDNGNPHKAGVLCT